MNSSASSPERKRLIFRIRLWVAVFIFGLVLSGVTAIPLTTETRWLVSASGPDELVRKGAAPDWAVWLVKVHAALEDTARTHPFLFYGTDWLAFGHLMIALAFYWAWKDPVRNAWLFDYGLIACVLVIPWALCFGALRGIPWWWRLIDCSFGIFGFVPLWLCRRWARRLEAGPE